MDKCLVLLIALVVTILRLATLELSEAGNKFSIMGSLDIAATKRSTESREECIRKVVDYWIMVPIPKDVSSLVEEARQYYDLEEGIALIGDEYEVPQMSESCKTLKEAVFRQLKTLVKCWSDPRIMGRINKHQALLDLLREDTLEDEEVAYIKAIHESNYACKYGRYAGKAMREDGVFLIFENWKNELTYDQEIPKDSREQCMEKAIKFYESMMPLLNSYIQDRVKEARKYYRLEKTISGYTAPLMSKSCLALEHVSLIEERRTVPCLRYKHIIDQTAWSVIYQRSRAARLWREAEFVCYHGLNAGLIMRHEGLYEKIVDLRQLPNDTREQCVAKMRDYLSSLAVSVGDELQHQVAEARKYYYISEPIVGYREPPLSNNCKQLDYALSDDFIDKIVSCWNYADIIGDKNQAWSELYISTRNNSARAIQEARYVCHHGLNAGLVMRQEGLFEQLVHWTPPIDTRDECLVKMNNNLGSLMPLGDDLEDLVLEARSYYRLGHRILTGGYQTGPPPLSDACKRLNFALSNDQLGETVPCWSYAHIISNEHEAWLEMYKRGINARAVREAEYVCHNGLDAGFVMRQEGTFELIVDWQLPADSREECLDKMEKFLDSLLPLNDDLQALVREAQKYYHLEQRIPGYRPAFPLDSCKKLGDTLAEEQQHGTVACFTYETIISDENKAWLELYKRSEAARRVEEASKACKHGHNAGVVMKCEGIFDLIVNLEM